MSSIGVNDIFEELSEENKRLLNELIFADKCLDVLIKFKTFIDLFSDKLKTNLNSIESQNFEQLCEEITHLLNTHKNTRDGQSSHQLTDEELIDVKPNLSYVIPNNEDTNETNPSFDDNSTDPEFITSDVINDEIINENIDQNNDLFSKEVILKCLDINCGLIFEEPSELKSHSKTVHSIYKAFKCHFEGCGRTYDEYNKLTCHIKYHKGIKLFVCEYDSCDKSFVRNSQLRAHIRVMHLTKGRPFVCQLCKKGFRTKGALNVHGDMHNIDRRFTCDQPNCQFETHSRASLQGHFYKKHTERMPRVFVCTVEGCGVTYKTNRTLKIHILSHQLNDNSKQKFKCDLKNCKKVFLTEEKLLDHQKVCQLPVKLVECDWPGCDFTTRKNYHLSVHQKRIHYNDINAVKRFICPFEGCLQRYENNVTLQSHINRHNGDRPFICEEEGCGKAFFSKVILKKHIKHNHIITEKLFKCEYNSCNKSFKTKGLLSNHKFTHLESKPFHCNVSGCLFRTHNPRSLTAHLKLTHSDERPFHCQVEGCSYSVKMKGTLKEHMRTVHTTDRPVICDVDGCGKTFKTELHLKKHQNLIHEEREVLVCDWPGCKFQSISKSSFKCHKEYHQNKRQFMCDWPECGKRFNTKQHLNFHIRVHKSDKRYACSWPGCSYRCVFGGNLNKHMRVHQK